MAPVLLIGTRPGSPVGRSHDPVRRRRGHSMIEAIAVALILAFLMAASGAFLQAGERQSRLARNYSQAQVDLRSALRRATSGLRHAFRVVATSSSPTFSGASTSNMSQVIVLLPQPTGTGDIEARYYLSNGTFYVQRDSDVGTGDVMASGIQALEFHYFRVNGSTRANVDNAPNTASEVQIRLSARRGPAVTTVETLVLMRNSVTGVP